MRLVGKKVERMNKYGDDLCIHLKDKGAMKLSPALMSKLNIAKGKNKGKKEYSLGDVLLLQKYEKILRENGYKEPQIQNYSPSYYKI